MSEPNSWRGLMPGVRMGIGYAAATLASGIECERCLDDPAGRMAWASLWRVCCGMAAADRRGVRDSPALADPGRLAGGAGYSLPFRSTRMGRAGGFRGGRAGGCAPWRRGCRAGSARGSRFGSAVDSDGGSSLDPVPRENCPREAALEIPKPADVTLGLIEQGRQQDDRQPGQRRRLGRLFGRREQLRVTV